MINNVTVDSTYNSITINVNANGGDGSIVSYHYSRDDGSNYTESNNASYTFNNLTSSTTFYIKVYVTDSNGRTSSEYSTSVTTESAILADYLVNTVYTGTDGDNGLYYHDGTGSYENANLEAGDNSYRYAGANPNNYVCFGSDEVTCPTDNLYRIIGIFNGQVKLIKNSSIGVYYWSGSSSTESNNWSSTPVNTNVLNNTYLSSLDTWSSKIATTSWKIGGNTINNLLTNSMPLVYAYEISMPASSAVYNAKIGLMYISDYMYAAGSRHWSDTVYNFARNKDLSDSWIFSGNEEMTITRASDDNINVFYILSSGRFNFSFANYVNCDVRPVFYLNSNVILTGGTGTQADPYRIA